MGIMASIQDVPVPVRTFKHGIRACGAAICRPQPATDRAKRKRRDQQCTDHPHCSSQSVYPRHSPLREFCTGGRAWLVMHGEILEDRWGGAFLNGEGGRSRSHVLVNSRTTSDQGKTHFFFRCVCTPTPFVHSGRGCCPAFSASAS